MRRCGSSDQVRKGIPLPLTEVNYRIISNMARQDRTQDAALIRAWGIANSDEDLRAMERELDLISGDIAEPWTTAPKQ
jgi:hypothetical protein